MNNNEEQAYLRRERAVARSIIAHAIKYLPEGEKDLPSLQAYVEEIRQAVQSIYEHAGLEFDPDLHLADAIRGLEKVIPEAPPEPN